MKKCFACNYEGEFGYLHGMDGVYGFMQEGHIGGVSIKVCPNCGILHTTMRNEIYTMKETK